MATDSKKISIYMIGGIVLAAIIISAVYTSGIPLPTSNIPSEYPTASPTFPIPTDTSNPPTTPIITDPSSTPLINTGTLVVSIKDAPVDIEELWVTLDGLEVQGNEGWIEIEFLEDTETVTFDLLTLQDISKDLSATQLPAGNYTKIRLHVQEANATFQDGSEAELKVPSEKLDVIIKFEINDGQTTEVLIDMTADWIAISNSHNLRPVLKALVNYPNTEPDLEETQNQIPTETPPETPEPTETPKQTEDNETNEPTETPMPTPEST